MIAEPEVRSALRDVAYPGLKRDIVSLGLVRSVTVREGRVHVSLTLATERAEVPDQLRTAIRERLARAGAVRSEVQIVAPERTRARDPWEGRVRLPGVRHVVAVGAGKGGVGKSTVALGLALALRDLGLRAGILDADIYGPSVPVLVGLEDGARHVRMTAERQILPLEAMGLAVVSFGFFLGAESPAVWRGPMVGKAVKQFAQGVVWPSLDVLIVDLPPGTGDVPLSLAQSVVVDGAVVVTTPQRLAVLEAAKAVDMFARLGVPVLGIVENMSHATCGCGARSHPFGTGGGRALADASQCTLLGGLPFDPAVVAASDGGGADAAVPAAETRAVLAHVAAQVWARVSHEAAAPDAEAVR